MGKLLALIITIIIVASCSSLSKKQTLPPVHLKALLFPVSTEKEVKNADLFLEAFKKENPEDEGAIWWAKYNQGLVWQKQDPAKSCLHFTELANTPNFPLAKVSELKSDEVCPDNALRAQSIWDIAVAEDGSWLKKYAVELSLTRAEGSKDKPKLMHLSNEKSKWLEKPAEKLEAVQLAVALAEELKDPEALKKFQTRIHFLAPRFIPEPVTDQFLSVADDFKKIRSFEKARNYYRNIIKNKKFSYATKVEALKGIRHSYKLENNKPKYVTATRELVKYIETQYKKDARFRKDYHDAQVTLVRTLWTENKVSEAEKLLNKLTKQLKGKYPLAEILWMKSRMAEEKGDFVLALQHNDDALKDTPETHPLWETMTWQKAWNLRKGKDYDQSIALMEKLREMASPNGKSKYTFWLAKTLKANQDEIRASLELQRLIEADPLSYYGIMASRELGLQFEPLKVQSLTRSQTPSFMEQPEYSQLRWLISVGETSLSKEFLKSTLKAAKALTPEDEKVLVTLYGEIGDFSGLFDYLNRWSGDARRDLLNSNPELLFPRPYLQKVSEAAESSQVPQELIYAIMRQESAFNPFARSPADAFGLMQLTPETARRANDKGLVVFDKPEDLYFPQVNIPLGANELRRTLERFDKQFILAVASYNASEDAVRGWVKTRYREDPIEFIEDIPYQETMTYVKLVLRNMVFYQRLNSKGTMVQFPEWTLEGLASFK